MFDKTPEGIKRASDAGKKGRGKKCPGLSKRMKENNPMKLFIGAKHFFWGQKRPEISKRTKENNPMKLPEVKEKVSKIRKDRFSGENHPWFGKKRPDIAKLMKNGGALKARLACRFSVPSKEQIKLFKKIIQFYPTAKLEHPYRNYFIDIAIPEQKIAIEYDGEYWHRDREEADKRRQAEIEKGGWKVFRFKKIPTTTELVGILGR